MVYKSLIYKGFMYYFAIAVLAYFTGFFTHKYIVDKTKAIVSAAVANVKVDVDKLYSKVTVSQSEPQVTDPESTSSP